MGRYALIESATGIVVNVMVWDGETGNGPGEGYIAVETDEAGPDWTYVNGAFVAPPPPTLSDDEIKAVNQATRASLSSQASTAMTPLLVALQLGNATDSEAASAKAWQAYYRELQAVDLTVDQPIWPAIPESR